MLKDIKKEFQEIDTDRKRVRDFAILFCIIFCALAAWISYRGKPCNYTLIGAGILFLTGGLFFYRLMLPVYMAWMLLGILLGAVMSRVVLMFLFYLVFTPMNLLLRVIGKDILDQKIVKEQKS